MVVKQTMFDSLINSKIGTIERMMAHQPRTMAIIGAGIVGAACACVAACRAYGASVPQVPPARGAPGHPPRRLGRSTGAGPHDTARPRRRRHHGALCGLPRLRRSCRARRRVGRVGAAAGRRQSAPRMRRSGPHSGAGHVGSVPAPAGRHFNHLALRRRPPAKRPARARAVGTSNGRPRGFKRNCKPRCPTGWAWRTAGSNAQCTAGATHGPVAGRGHGRALLVGRCRRAGRLRRRPRWLRCRGCLVVGAVAVLSALAAGVRRSRHSIPMHCAGYSASHRRLTVFCF